MSICDKFPGCYPSGMTESKHFVGNPTSWSRRAALRVGFAGACALGNAGCARAAPGPPVSVKRFGAGGDGRGDDTRAFQAAIDSLAGGGVVQVPPGRYSVSLITVRHRGISVRLDAAATIVKRGSAGPESRGIFVLDGLIDAQFELSGGSFDLNGEGPREIGVPGRIPNEYHHLTIATVIGISGPANAVVFARRSSRITVSGITVANSGENGLLFRNCGQVQVQGCRFSNLANYAIEISLTNAVSDGGAGRMPARNHVTVSDCHFEGIDDYALGSGNGGGIGGGGGANLGSFTNYLISRCTFIRCHRDIHFEFEHGSWLEGFAISGIRSTEPRQGSIGLVAARRGEISDVSILNPGSAPAALLIPARPEIFGIVLSSDFFAITLRDITISDDRDGRQVEGSGGSIARGSRQLSVQTPVFQADDVDRWIGILGANPSGSAYVGRIARVLSPSKAELDLPAGATVRNARFAIGGLTRNGLILNSGTDVLLDNVRITAGAAGDTRGLTDAAAIRMQDMRGTVRFTNVALQAPIALARAKPAGVRLIRNRARISGLDGIGGRGFATNVVNER